MFSLLELSLSTLIFFSFDSTISDVVAHQVEWEPLAIGYLNNSKKSFGFSFFLFLVLIRDLPPRTLLIHTSLTNRATAEGQSFWIFSFFC